MKESLGEIVRRGFDLWRRNLVLSVWFIFACGFLFWILIVMVLFVPFFVMDPTYYMEEVNGIEYIFFFIFPFTIYSFLLSDAIAMVEEAVEMRRISTDTMSSSWMKHGVNMLLLLIVIGPIAFAIAIKSALIVEGLLGDGSSSYPIVKVIYHAAHIIIPLAFTVMPIPLVIDDLRPINAVKASLGFFLENKIDVLAISALQIIGWNIAMVEIIDINNMQFNLSIGGIDPIIWFIGLFISYVVIGPLTVIWLTWLYMDSTGRLDNITEDMGSGTRVRSAQ